MQARARVRAERSVAVDDATASATSVRAQDADSALRDVPQAIVQVPGVHVQQTGGFGSVAYAALRGAEIGQTSVLLDTIPLNTADSGPFDLSLLPLEALDRVEVYRGGAPVWIGDGAIGGIVRLVPAQAERTFTRASLGGGSFGRFDSRARARSRVRLRRTWRCSRTCGSDARTTTTRTSTTARHASTPATTARCTSATRR